MSEMITAIGLMSGTSMDGVDAAIIKTDGNKIELTEYFITVPYKKDFIKRIRSALRKYEIDDLDLEKNLTEAHATAVSLLLNESKLKPSDIDIIGFHGQTILHDPQHGITKQIGNGKLLAELTGIDVVNDFRSNDMVNGGQGAPLAPMFHKAFFSDEEKPIAVVNIGGVANVTFIDKDEQMLAFDTGPGNALINDWVFQHKGMEFDENGEIASSGTIDQVILEGLLSHEYFDKLPPKSLDRNDFSIKGLAPLSLEDGAATLTAFTAQSIANSAEFFYNPTNKWIIIGGGRYNGFLVKQIRTLLDSSVVTAEEIGVNGDAIEAQAFAFHAVRSLKKLPLTFPTTTGVKSEVTGGVFCPA